MTNDSLDFDKCYIDCYHDSGSPQCLYGKTAIDLVMKRIQLSEDSEMFDSNYYRDAIPHYPDC